jgi:putative alpha-1,2-mannosidase
MKKLIFISFTLLFACSTYQPISSKKNNSNFFPTNHVNVFLGTSGDHGQMSPSASSPFNMMSIGPQTLPNIQSGYEHYAKKFLGFTHTRIEGVGCTGSGGNILIKPLLNGDIDTELLKKGEHGEPGYYSVNFENGLKADMSVKHNFGIHRFKFPNKNTGLMIDLSFAFVNRFVKEEHTIENNQISGWIDTETTCSRGVYRIYYSIKIANPDTIHKIAEHKYQVTGKDSETMEVRIGFSSVSVAYAKEKIEDIPFEELEQQTSGEWNHLLGRIQVEGEKDREDLFYSLLYRGLQAPYLISEDDGTYAAIDGTTQKMDHNIYNGWAIWDNYREQLPLLSLAYPEKYDDISRSIANMYNYGKQDWATKTEPSPTVRTEHAVVVLLDAYRKGFDIDFESIKNPLLEEMDNLGYGAPDKALESSYDIWAMSQILKITGDTTLSKKYLKKAEEYKGYWKKDFKDLTRNDIDRMQARGLYQGTIWQYRWFVPFDLKGLKNLAGGEEEFIKQLDQFFEEDNYNHANQPDLQVPGIYNATSQPWKSQKLFRNILLDTVVQNYFNDNSKGIDPYIGRIYQNKPKAYLRTMDDDAGTMSSWFVMRSIGLSPANIGSPVYYLTAPIFKSVKIEWEKGNSFKIIVSNYNKNHFYIDSATLNGKPLKRNWLTNQEIMNGGELIIKTSSEPNKEWGIENPWVSSIEPEQLGS